MSHKVTTLDQIPLFDGKILSDAEPFLFATGWSMVYFGPRVARFERENLILRLFLDGDIAFHIEKAELRAKVDALKTAGNNV